MGTTITATTIIAMAIPSEIGPLGLKLAASLLRAFVCILGIGAVAWGGYLLPLLRQQGRLDHIASEYLLGQGFKDQTLLAEARQITDSERSAFCNPVELHNAVILHLAILNDAIAAANPALIDSSSPPLDAAAHRALICSPSDSFAWLTLFWLDAGRHGVTTDNLNYLRLSYAFGPNEEWIALWRSRLAVAAFEHLPPALADEAIAEFVKLVNTGGLYPQTATIFASAAPAVQSRLAARLSAVNPIAREIFARTLYDRGLDVAIPGVAKPARPWE